MELLIEQCEHNGQSEEPCEECTPKIETEPNTNNYEYDYNKRLWF